MMKTKSESNLLQRFDFVAVDIPLEAEPKPEKKDEDVKRFIDENEQDAPEEEEPPSSGQRGRRPSVFEEGLKDFYDLKSVGKKDTDSKIPEITVEDLDIISGQTTE